jgi:membrane protease YdiL (CAAX protease family)
MSRPRQLVLYFVLAFAGTWGLAAVLMLAPGLLPSNALFFAAVYVPSVVGVLLTAVFDGKQGLARFAGRLNPLGFKSWWWLVVLVGLPLVCAAGGLLLGDRLAFPGIAAALLLLARALVFDPGPIGEEFGWRGFALPRLLERFTPLWASLILGTLWGLWHLPVLINPAFPQYEMGVPRFVLGAITLTIAMTWVHLGTSGSILLAILFHLVVNTAGGLTGVSFPGQTLGIAIAAVVIVLLAWRRHIIAPPRVPPAS